MAFEGFLIDFLVDNSEFVHDSVPELEVPSGKVDGIDGGFVNDGTKSYWVTSKGRYGYVEGIGRTWIIDHSHFAWR